MSDERPERVSASARLSVALFQAAEWVAPRVSYRTGRAFSRWAGAALARLPGARRPVTRNLSRVLGEEPGGPLLDAAVLEACRSYALYWFETFHLRGMTIEEVDARMRFHGEEHIRAAIDAGHGAIMALPHLGNWDAPGHWIIRARGFRMTAVAEELKPEAAFELFYRHRRALGMGIVPLGSKRVAEELVGILADNQMLCLLADRDLTGRGVDVELFGGRAQMPAGPAMLALTTGAALLPAAVYHGDDGGWDVFIGAPVTIERTESLRDDVTALTRKLAASFERGIAGKPTDWHMFQDYWPA